MSARRYRKKPVEVLALKFEVGRTSKGDILAFCPEANVGTPPRAPFDIRWIVIETLEGAMEVSDGDFIIRGITGEFYPCKPDVFEMTYDEVGDA